MNVPPNVTQFEPAQMSLTVADLFQVKSFKWTAAYDFGGELGPKSECFVSVILKRKFSSCHIHVHVTVIIP